MCRKVWTTGKSAARAHYAGICCLYHRNVWIGDSGDHSTPDGDFARTAAGGHARAAPEACGCVQHTLHRRRCEYNHNTSLVNLHSNHIDVLQIFFVKSFLRAWDCVGTESDNGRRFLASAPEMECTDNPASASFEQYQDIRWLSALGLACFIAGFVALWLAMLREHRADTASIGMFAFLSTKYENDRCAPS